MENIHRETEFRPCMFFRLVRYYGRISYGTQISIADYIPSPETEPLTTLMLSYFGTQNRRTGG